MNSSPKLFLWCLYIFILSASGYSGSTYNNIHNVGPHFSTFLNDPAKKPTNYISVDYQTFFYNQTLDHFNYNPESYTTFQQRYFINSKYWGGAKSNAPILAFLGAEAPIDKDPENIGFMTNNALHFSSLLIYIEHRFYGKSVPFVSFEEAMKNETLRGYFNSAQALADYAEVLLHLKKTLYAEDSPIIVLGGSYGGMLASWFRLKYPHIAIGALASSAPILYFDRITPQDGYFSAVTKDFQEASESCYKTIRKSWKEIDKIASGPDGLSFLARKFKTCRTLNDPSELKSYLTRMYATVAQYDIPPNYPVTVVCGGIDGAPRGSDILDRIFAGVVAFKGDQPCYFGNENPKPSQETQTNEGYSWQSCTEMVMPIGVSGNQTMFPLAPFDITTFIDNCKATYGVEPRPHWVTTYYGGQDLKKVFRRFASNIIFSNGLRDPYSIGGVLEDISETVRAVSTTKGSHCLDILNAQESDPTWLTKQRQTEIKIIDGWLKTYYTENMIQYVAPSGCDKLVIKFGLFCLVCFVWFV